eukprot:GEZU01022326.1.p1 GENE.GEZU01022326.1~~GEZU01022326.1.p1  ORF type:complete len:417 (+),score=138.71 GEZU01022326.1:73-1323(+)
MRKFVTARLGVGNNNNNNNSAPPSPVLTGQARSGSNSPSSNSGSPRISVGAGDLFDNITGPDMEDDGVALKEGNLTKEGGNFKYWRKRWFKLRPDALFYYKNPHDKRPAGIIRLKHAAVSKDTTRQGKQHCFKIQTSDIQQHRTFYMCADSEAEMLSWIDAIQNAIYQLRASNASLSALSLGDSSSPGSMNGVNSPGIGKQKKKRELIRVTPADDKLLTEEEEYDVAVSAAAIFLKLPSERTPEEQAYVYAMEEYARALAEHMKKTNATPEFGLASGTYIFAIPPEKRTQEEQAYVDSITAEYYAEIEAEAQDLEMDSSDGGNALTLDEQAEIAKGAALIFSKKPEDRTPEEQEYVNKLEEYMMEVSRIERENGYEAQHNLASGSIVFAKFDTERKPSEIDYINEVMMLAQTEMLS